MEPAVKWTSWSFLAIVGSLLFLACTSRTLKSDTVWIVFLTFNCRLIRRSILQGHLQFGAPSGSSNSRPARMPPQRGVVKEARK
jgi:hypothetical protein